MNEMVFEGINELYNHLASKGGANNQSHGMFGVFYQSMAVYTNPNTCSCKKGAGVLANINSMYSKLHLGLTQQTSSQIKALFDNNTVVLKLNGAEVGRF